MTKNEVRMRKLRAFQLTGRMSGVELFDKDGGNRSYLPENGFAVGLYIERAGRPNESFPVKQVTDFKDGYLGSLCTKYKSPALDSRERPWVGCLLVDVRWNAKFDLEDRNLVQLQSFTTGLIAVPVNGEFITEDSGDGSKLLAITMSIRQGKVTSSLHWRTPADVIGIDTWKWPD